MLDARAAMDVIDDRGARAPLAAPPRPVRARHNVTRPRDDFELPVGMIDVTGPVRLAAMAGALSGLYALGALLPFWYLTSPDSGAAFFPAAGLTLSVLVLTPRRTWPLWLAVVAVTEITVDMTHGQPLVMSLGFALANTAEPLVGALGLRHVANKRWPTLRHVLVRYVGWGVFIGPVVGAVIATATFAMVGHVNGLLSLAGTWWLGDALGVLVVATPIIAWRTLAPFDARASALETTAIVVLATSVTIIPALLWHHPMVYAVLPVLVWGALRGGTRAVSLAGVGVAFAVDWAAVTGRADQLVVADNLTSQLVVLQLFLGVTLLTALTLAVEVADRKGYELSARAADEARIRAELEAVEAADTERRRVARETHDIVGHALGVMLLQAGAARRVLDVDVDLARECLESIETAGRAAFGELDIALASSARRLDLPATRGVADVPELVEVLRRAGMDITLAIDAPSPRLPTLVDRSAYRIVQEALTNVAKHAPGSAAQVTIQFEPGLLSLAIVDDGTGASPSASNGRGLGVVGMRERVEALAGTISVGRSGTSGYTVQATLPTGAQR
jgi:signal transduction histidine kinase